MTLKPYTKLISYIAPGAPATRRPARGDEPLLRPEIGFTPKWYHDALGIDFGERWHTDPEYRSGAILSMKGELRRRFGDIPLGELDGDEGSIDSLTGTFGACAVGAIYGLPIRYAKDQWPKCDNRYLSPEQVRTLEPPNLDINPFFRGLMGQVDFIAARWGHVRGFLNWQGVLNNAYRLRGLDLFTDLILEPDLVRRLFECVTVTMIDGARRLYARQRQTGVEIRHFTVSNCLVNMIAPQQYRDLLLPFDQRISEEFGLIGVHNCAWNATPYLEHYAKIPHVAYIDMGLDSDLVAAKNLFPETRRAIMYTPMDVVGKPFASIRKDFERITVEYAPCDIVLADIESGASDDRVKEIFRLCEELSAGRSTEF